MTLRERLEWVSRMSLLVFILASAAFLSAITAMRVAIHGREVTMPNLVGKNVTEASPLLRSRGLVLRVADRVYSDLPANVVVRQTPTAGLLMKVSQQAHVVLSLGQRQLSIPRLEGTTLRISRIEMLREGLQIGEVSNITLPNVPACGRAHGPLAWPLVPRIVEAGIYHCCWVRCDGAVFPTTSGKHTPASLSLLQLK